MNYNNFVIIYGNYLYCHHNDLEFVIEYRKTTINHSAIIDEEDFIKKYSKVMKQKKLSTFFFNKKLLVIYDSRVSKNDLNMIKLVFNNLNYRSVIYKSDVSLIKNNKKDNYLLLGSSCKFIYTDKYNTRKTITIDNNLSDNEVSIIIANRSYKKNLFIIGKDINPLLLKNKNYYIYDSIIQFFLQIINSG